MMITTATIITSKKKATENCICELEIIWIISFNFGSSNES